MKVIVLADRPASELAPISSHIAPPLMPVGGRPLIEHTLETLSGLGCCAVDIVLAAHDLQTRRHLARVGFPTLDLTLRHLPPSSARNWCVAVRGDTFVLPAAVEIAVACARSGQAFHGVGRHAGVRVLAPFDDVPDWTAFRRDALTVLGTPTQGFFLDLAGYHSLALEAAKGIDGLVPAGWTEPDGTRVDVKAILQTRGRLGPGVLVGAESFVAGDVTATGGVVIGRRCVIGPRTRLTRAVVLDHSFLGPDLTVKDAIVAGRHFYKVDQGFGITLLSSELLGQSV